MSATQWLRWLNYRDNLAECKKGGKSGDVVSDVQTAPIDPQTTQIAPILLADRSDCRDSVC